MSTSTTLAPALAPVMEAISVPGTISGSSIIGDLLDRIGDRLSRDCSLRPIDVYAGYAFKVSITLQLHDVYPTEVTTEIAVGRLDPKLEVQQIELGSDITAAEPEPSNLERPVDNEGAVPEASAKRRYYTPRGTVPPGMRGSK